MKSYHSLFSFAICYGIINSIEIFLKGLISITTNNFGKFLKDLRLSKGLTLVELSKLSKISQPHLSHIENGKRGVPSSNMLNGLSRALDMRYGDLLVATGIIDESDNIPMDSINENPRRKTRPTFDLETYKLEQILKKSNIVRYENEILRTKEKALIDDFIRILIKHRSDK